MYATLGHFGRRPIQISWFALVFPALVLNYAGQAAVVVADPAAIENPFYRCFPDWALLPMVGLAALDTVIASQAVISAGFSVARQAIQLGLLPRLTVQHTSKAMSGQIFPPTVNGILLVGVVLLIVVFKTSSNLASAYGITLTGALVMDTLLAFFVFKTWRIPRLVSFLFCMSLLCVEMPFFF